jgi:Sec-independent protein secretion pathway component TatC
MKKLLQLRFTEIGAACLLALLAYVAATFFFDANAFEQTGLGGAVRTALNVSTIFSVPFVFYVIFHAFFTRRWAWFTGCMLLLFPLHLVYWWRYVRPELQAHDAQQGVPGDVAASRRRA